MSLRKIPRLRGSLLLRINVSSLSFSFASGYMCSRVVKNSTTRRRSLSMFLSFFFPLVRVPSLVFFSFSSGRDRCAAGTCAAGVSPGRVARAIYRLSFRILIALHKNDVARYSNRCDDGERGGSSSDGGGSGRTRITVNRRYVCHCRCK